MGQYLPIQPDSPGLLLAARSGSFLAGKDPTDWDTPICCEEKGRVNRDPADYYPKMAGRRGRPPHDDLLTPAEWPTVYAVRHGLTNQQIADRRGISLDAVKYHVASAIAELGVSNRKALKSWAGSHKDSLLNTRKTVMNDDTKYFGVGQVSRSGSDIDAAERWYQDVLGLYHVYDFGDLAFFDCGGTRLMLSQAEKQSDGESLIYLRVPDIDAAHKRLTNNGVEFTNAPHMIHKHRDGTEEWMAFFSDPGGWSLAIMSVVESAENQVSGRLKLITLADCRPTGTGH